MSKKPGFPHSIDRDAPVVALLHNRTGDLIGYRIGGHTPGPEVVIVGYRSASAEAFHRLAQLPSLPFLLGQVTLIYQEALEDQQSGFGYAALSRRHIDGSLFISYDADNMTEDSLGRMRSDAYWSVLRLCARLGMINGRGVKQQDDAPHIMDGMISKRLTREGLLEARDRLLNRLGPSDKRVAV